MISEASDTLAALDRKVEGLRSDLGNVQLELDQALEVWRSALISEKKEFEALLQAKESVWNEQESEWQHQRGAYEQKIQALESAFKAQLDASEQSALRALNELDDAWQRDKLQWTSDTSGRIKEQEKTLEVLRLRSADLENLVQKLQSERAEFQAAASAPEHPSSSTWTQTQLACLEAQVAALDDLITAFVSSPTAL